MVASGTDLCHTARRGPYWGVRSPESGPFRSADGASSIASATAEDEPLSSSIGTRDTLKHGWIYSGGAIVGKFVSFFMLPLYAHILRGDGYAVIGILDASVAILVALLGYGIRGTCVRLYHDETETKRRQAVISTGIYLITVSTVALVIPLIILSRPLTAVLLNDPNLAHLLIMVLISLVFDMGGQGASSWLLIQSRSITFASLELIRLIINLSLNIWLLVIRDMGLNGYFVSALASNVTVGSLYMCLAFRACKHRFDKEIVKKMIAYLGPLVPGSVIAYASQQAERFIVRFRIDLASVGVLEMGYKFPMLIAQMITTPFMQSWDTRRFSLIANDEEAPRRIGEMFTYYLFLVTYVGLVMAVMLEPILVILTPPEFHIAYRIAQIEIVTLIFSGVYYHVAVGLLYAKQTRVLSTIRGGTSLGKIGVSWILISKFGIMGAAWSGAIIAVLTAVIVFLLSQRRFRMTIEWANCAAIAAIAGAMFATIDGLSVEKLGLFHTIDNSVVPRVAEFIAKTPLDAWKDGRLPALLVERSSPLAEAMVKGLLASTFGVSIVFLRNGSLVDLRDSLFRMTVYQARKRRNRERSKPDDPSEQP